MSASGEWVDTSPAWNPGARFDLVFESVAVGSGENRVPETVAVVVERSIGNPGKWLVQLAGYNFEVSFDAPTAVAAKSVALQVLESFVSRALDAVSGAHQQLTSKPGSPTPQAQGGGGT